MRVICVFLGKPCATPDATCTIEALAESFYRLSPDICLRKDQAIFVEVSQCRLLYREETVVLKIRALLKRFALEASVAVGDSIPESLCLAASEPRPLADLPLSFLRFYVDPFDCDEPALKAAELMIAALEKLGLRTLGDFKALPRRSFSSRFGKTGQLCFERLSHPQLARLIPWPRWRPPDRIVERCEFMDHESCASLDPLFFKIKELLGRVVSRLRARGLRTTRLSMTLETEKHSGVKNPKRVWNFNFLNPQGSVRGISLILRERLSFELAKSPLESEVLSLTLQVIETAPGQGAQKNFFHQREERDEALHALIDRVAEKLGPEQVFRARLAENYLPEKSWEKEKPSPAAESAQASALPYGLRPLRLLHPPKPLNRVDCYLMHGSHRWKITSFSGPERIAGMWWESPVDQDVLRDYYEVETESGERLWVFKETSGRLFLHGIFNGRDHLK